MDGLAAEIARTRALTSKPFGVNVILATAPKGVVDLCIEERVPVLVLFWGDPSPWVESAHRRGIKVVVQLGSLEDAQVAARAGVDAIILQGIEAGGHVLATTSLWANLPAVVDAVWPVPVLAAGGIATGRGLVAALTLGAQGASLGTRFLATREAFVTAEYKERVVNARAEDTVYCELFDGGWPAPHRVLRNKAVAEWEAAGRPASGQRPGEGTIVGTVVRSDAPVPAPRYGASMPSAGDTADLEYFPLYCGESCTLVNDIKPAGDVVREIVAEAEGILQSRGG